MNSTRIGKIARLPYALREELNQRLADGQPGPDLLAWLNGLDPVRQILAAQFGGHSISAQNLTEWKQGGYRDWERAVENRVLAQEFIAEAGGLAEETGEVPLADRLSTYAALTLGQLLRAAMDEEGPERYTLVLKIVRELDRLRRGDHRQARVAFQRERWETAYDDALEDKHLKELKEHQQRHLDHLEAMQEAAAYREMCYWEGLRKKTLSPEMQAQYEAYFRAHPDQHPQWRTKAEAGKAGAAGAGNIQGEMEDGKGAKVSGASAPKDTSPMTTQPARPSKSAKPTKPVKSAKPHPINASAATTPVQSNSNQIKPIQTSL